MLTKAPIEIMQLFTSSITNSFRPKDVSKAIGMDYKHVHVTLKSLSAKKLLKEVNGLYSLNYKENHQILAYIEHLRSEVFLKSRRNAYVKLVVQDVLDRISHPSFIFLLFGSRVINDPKADDVDLMIIVETENKAGEIQKISARSNHPLN